MLTTVQTGHYRFFQTKGNPTWPYSIRKLSNYSKCSMEEGGIYRLTATGEAVVKRFQSIGESFLAPTPPRLLVVRQSQIIHDCLILCADLQENPATISECSDPVDIDEASKLILDTLLILQDERPPPPGTRVCIGDLRGCPQPITRIRSDPGVIHVQALETVLTIPSQPAGSYYDVSSISLFPVIRAFDHPLLCPYHEDMVAVNLHEVLVTQSVIEGADAAHELLTGPRNQTHESHGTLPTVQ